MNTMGDDLVCTADRLDAAGPVADVGDAVSALRAAAAHITHLTGLEDAASRYASDLTAALNETRRALHRLCTQIERLGHTPQVDDRLAAAAALAVLSDTSSRRLPPTGR